jgi:hypothetical protein
MRTAHDSLQLVDSLRLIGYSVAVGFALVMILAVWWL